MRILFICTGNSCRSAMAKGFLQSINPNLEVFSAGIKPEFRVNPFAVKVMKEKSIDISGHVPQHINHYLNDSFDFLVSLCDFARDHCPEFIGKIYHRLHQGFIDPANATGTDEEILLAYRKVRDELEKYVSAFYISEVLNQYREDNLVI